MWSSEVGTSPWKIPLHPFALVERLGIGPTISKILKDDSAPDFDSAEQYISYVVKQRDEVLPQKWEDFNMDGLILDSAGSMKALYESNQDTNNSINYFTEIFDKAVIEPSESLAVRKLIKFAICLDRAHNIPPKNFSPDLQIQLLTYIALNALTAPELSLTGSEEIYNLPHLRILNRIYQISMQSLVEKEDCSVVERQRVTSFLEDIKLENQRDYMDCEYIHHLVAGHLENNLDGPVPVTLFTNDRKAQIVRRATSYWSLIAQMQEFIRGKENSPLHTMSQDLLGRIVLFDSPDKFF